MESGKDNKKFAEKREAEENSTSKHNPLAKYAYFSGIGFQMIAIIGAFTYAGYRIDQTREAGTPIWTALLSLTGVILSIYIVIRAVTRRK